MNLVFWPVLGENESFTENQYHGIGFCQGEIKKVQI